jgi:hypothetical protein
VPASPSAPAHPFVARLFESPAIKSFRDAEALVMKRALAFALDAVSDGSPLVLDLLVELEAEHMEARLAGAEVLHWRSRPSTSVGARMRRTMGFYSGESTLCAAVRVPTGDALVGLLVGNTLWEGELSIYPPPTAELRTLPDPHFEIAGFAACAAWTINQDAGTDSWLLTGLTEQSLERLSTALARAFQGQGLPARLKDAPPEVFRKAPA